MAHPPITIWDQTARVSSKAVLSWTYEGVLFLALEGVKDGATGRSRYTRDYVDGSIPLVLGDDLLNFPYQFNYFDGCTELFRAKAGMIPFLKEKPDDYFDPWMTSGIAHFRWIDFKELCNAWCNRTLVVPISADIMA